MADNVDKEDRARFNGYLGLSYGIGVFIGPKLGGYLGGISLDLSTGVATYLSLFSFLIVLIFLKNNHLTNNNN